MTDNFEDFEHAEGEHHDEPAALPTGLRANVVSAWKSNPIFKLFVLMVVVGATVAVGISLFSDTTPKSAVGLIPPPNLHQPPGGPSSPYIQDQTKMANQQRVEEALKEGGSAVPTPIGPGTDSGELALNSNKEDPLNELRAEVENMNKELQETKQVQQAPPPAPAAPEPFDDSLAQAMQKQMGQLLDSWTPKGNRGVVVSDLALPPNDQQSGSNGNSGISTNNNNATQSVAAPAPPAKIIVTAGTVSYAQLLTEANSDVPGPILAQIVSGPLKGARAIGQFTVDEGSNYLILTFKLADLKGTDYRINALALDPDTTLGGMATETDQRYMTRLVLPAAAAFLQGIGTGMSQQNSSVVVSGSTTTVAQTAETFKQAEYQGLGAAAQTAGQFFQNQANLTKPLVRVAAGTPMGLFFVDSVTDQSTQNYQNAQNNYNNSNFVNGVNGPQSQNGYGGNNTTNGSNGYPVLYPNANTPQTPNNNSVRVLPNEGSMYPGSSVYYSH